MDWAYRTFNQAGWNTMFELLESYYYYLNALWNKQEFLEGNSNYFPICDSPTTTQLSLATIFHLIMQIYTTTF